MRVGISIKKTIGIGDKIQFSSLPENYYRATGQKLYDISMPWFFDHNPYVVRDPGCHLDKRLELWNFGPARYPWPKPPAERESDVFLSNAEIWCRLFGITPSLIRPRLYKFEDYPFAERNKILLHTHGRSHGHLPPEIVDHVIKKYKPTGNLYLIGNRETPDYGIPKIETETLWDLAELLSTARMFIGIDSGPSWIAACFPDVVLKKVRTKPWPHDFEMWVPLHHKNIHSHWDDRIFQIYNTSTEDVGFTQSYLKL